MFFIPGSESLRLGYDININSKLKSRVRPGFLEVDKQSVYDDEVRDMYTMVNCSSLGFVLVSVYVLYVVPSRVKQTKSIRCALRRAASRL